MRIENIRVQSLGVKEKTEETVYNGQTTAPYISWSFVVVNEMDVRKHFVSNPSYSDKAMLRPVAEWGTMALISGEINSKGKIEVTDIKVVEDDNQEVL